MNVNEITAQYELRVKALEIILVNRDLSLECAALLIERILPIYVSVPDMPEGIK